MYTVLDILAYQEVTGDSGRSNVAAGGIHNFRVRQSTLVAKYGFLRGAMALDLCTLPTHQSGKNVRR